MPFDFRADEDSEHEDRIRQSKKLAGVQEWWK